MLTETQSLLVVSAGEGTQAAGGEEWDLMHPHTCGK